MSLFVYFCIVKFMDVSGYLVIFSFTKIMISGLMGFVLHLCHNLNCFITGSSF